MKLREWILLTIGIYIGFGIGFGVMIVGYNEQIEQQKAIERGVIVQAEIYGAGNITTGNRKGKHLYGLYYRYIDEVKNIVYEGTIATPITDYDEAQSHKGEKVKIYISEKVFYDNKGVSIPVGYTTNAYTLLVIAIVFGTILLGYTIFLSIMIAKHFKAKRAKNGWDVYAQN